MARPRINLRFKLEPEGVRRALAVAEEIRPVFEKALGELLERFAVAMLAEARALCPVDTGTLQASIEAGVKATLNGWALELLANADGSAPYAGHVEFGTVAMPARPYIRPVAIKYRPMFVAELRALRDDVKKLAR